jgi:hypothetical protein
MRRATSQTLQATVHGTRRIVPIVPGTQIDLDEPIGDVVVPATDTAPAATRPLTLAEALGPALMALCDREQAIAPEAPRPRRRATTTDRGQDAAEE